VVAERRAVDELLGHGGGLVLVAGDLLDDDAALLVELGLVDLRPADEVGEEVERLHRALGAHGDVEGHEVVRRVGVQRAAHALGRLVDLAVVVELLAALEHEVLEEVRHAVLLGRSVRAPASNATRMVVARVPGRWIRCSGRPLASVVEVICAMDPHRCTRGCTHRAARASRLIWTADGDRRT
jgi:hypothetical protein